MANWTRRGFVGSLSGAAAAALECFREHGCSPGVGRELEVQVRTAITHTIGVKKLREWAGLALLC